MDEVSNKPHIHLVLGNILISKLCDMEKILSHDYLDISRRHAMTQNIIDYDK